MSGQPAPPSAPFNLAAHVLAAGLAHPDKIALAVLGPARAERWSYARLIAAVQGTATGLSRLGHASGDRILMRIGNTPDFPVIYLGAIHAGLVPIPTSAQLTAPEVRQIAAATRPARVIADPALPLPGGDIPLTDLATARGWHDLPGSAPDLGDPNRPAYIVYTSGTSGAPRAVVHAHRAILARALMMQGWYDMGPDDRMLHAGAFNWTFTLGTGLLDPWTLGATALIPATDAAPETLPLLLKRHDATLFAAAPGIYRRLLRSPLPALPRLRHGLSAGEKLPEPLRAAWRDATGTDLHEAYGLSECSTFLSGSPARPAPPGTLGFAQPGRRMALVDDGGQPAAQGTIAIHRSDPGLMLGYLDQPEETAARFAGDWFLTGDLAHETADGAIAYDGRADDMMNAGGLRVSPIEVEAALSTHPAISEAAACELTVGPDTTVIGAFYVPDGPDPGDETLGRHLAECLARYKCPRILVPVATLPRGANNKLQRRALRQAWEAEHGQT